MPSPIDQRPPVAVGHVRLNVSDVGAAARWLAGYQAVLEAVTANPDASTALVPVMPADEWLRVAREAGADLPDEAVEYLA